MMFYLMTPNESSFETIEEVPDYVKKVRTLSMLIHSPLMRHLSLRSAFDLKVSYFPY